MKTNEISAIFCFPFGAEKSSKINSFTISTHQQTSCGFFMFSNNNERSVKETLPKFIFV